jgi:prepilin-type N-terminal cleavage/methylation domain-containing protein
MKLTSGLRVRAFTLVELLVVISIIGLLASIVLVSLDSTRKKGRDSKRIADLKQIQLALELYFDQNNAFPPGGGGATQNCLTSAQLEIPGYLSKIPTDPLTGSCYMYVPYEATTNGNGVCSSFHLGATLETVGHSSLSQDSDITNPNSLGLKVCTALGAPSTDFNGLTTAANCSGAIGNASTETCYDIRP